jgi:hypothetical protein
LSGCVGYTDFGSAGVLRRLSQARSAKSKDG